MAFISCCYVIISTNKTNFRLLFFQWSQMYRKMGTGTVFMMNYHLVVKQTENIHSQRFELHICISYVLLLSFDPVGSRIFPGHCTSTTHFLFNKMEIVAGFANEMKKKNWKMLRNRKSEHIFILCGELGIKKNGIGQKPFALATFTQMISFTVHFWILNPEWKTQMLFCNGMNYTAETNRRNEMNVVFILNVHVQCTFQFGHIVQPEKRISNAFS